MKLYRISIGYLFIIFNILYFPALGLGQVHEIEFDPKMNLIGLLPLEQNSNHIGYLALFSDHDVAYNRMQFIAINKEMKILRKGIFEELSYQGFVHKYKNAEIIGDSLFLNSSIVQYNTDSRIIATNFGLIGAIFYVALFDPATEEKLHFIRAIDMKNNNDSIHQQKWLIKEDYTFSNNTFIKKGELEEKKSTFKIKALNNGYVCIKYPEKNQDVLEINMSYYNKKKEKIWRYKCPFDSKSKKDLVETIESITEFNNNLIIQTPKKTNGKSDGKEIFIVDIKTGKIKNDSSFLLSNNKTYSNFHFLKNNTNRDKILWVSKLLKKFSKDKFEGINLTYFDESTNTSKTLDIEFQSLDDKWQVKYFKKHKDWNLNKAIWKEGKIFVILQQEKNNEYSDLVFIVMNDDFTNVKIKIQEQEPENTTATIGELYKDEDKLKLNIFQNKLSLNFTQVQHIGGNQIILYPIEKKVPFKTDFVLEGEHSLVFAEIDDKNHKMILRNIGL